MIRAFNKLFQQQKTTHAATALTWNIQHITTHNKTTAVTLQPQQSINATDPLQVPWQMRAS